MKKKIILIATVALIAVLALSVMLVGCNKHYATPEEIKESGKLVVATSPDFPPFEFLQDGKAVGWDMDIAKIFADKLGVELEILSTEFDSVLSNVQTAKAHIGMAGISYSPARDKDVDFTDPVFDSTQVIMVKQGSSIKSGADLAGKVVGAQAGTVGFAIAKMDENWPTEIGAPASARSYTSGAIAVQDLEAGRIDAVILDILPATQIAANYNDIVILKDVPVFQDAYCFAVGEGNKALVDYLNVIIAEMKSDGTLDRLTAKWIG